MPNTGSQIGICDLPVRFDTYEGCSHACRYCFVNRKRDISHIGRGESAESLLHFIKGERTTLLSWCDWKIPIHFGGMSDPFQPVERTEKRTLAALKVLEQYHYPFVISTKNKMIAEEPYLSLIKNCNVVVQISAACPEYDQIEKGASTFAERVDAMRKISPYKRVIVRVQPYLPEMQLSVLKSLKQFADAGAYGITIEGMKYIKAKAGTIKVGGDCVYPAKLLREHFERIRNAVHALGMRFYCAENRLRTMGDDLCCCGIDGMGWQTNTCNLVHMIYDKDGVRVTDAQKNGDQRTLLHYLKQSSLAGEYGAKVTLFSLMEDLKNTKSEIKVIIPES